MSRPESLHHLSQAARPTRREFVKTSAAVGAATALGPAILASHAHAAGSDAMRVALIGCGGRGTGALENCLAAGKHLGLNMSVAAVADFFEDRAKGVGTKNGVPAERCFVGPTAYKDVMASDANLVLLATSPNFRPQHFEAAIEAGKHVFMEKPVAVDPPGARRILAAGEKAKQKGLAVVAGTQRRHDGNYRAHAQAIAEGQIGKIVGGVVYWCGGQLWYKIRLNGEADAPYMVRNWVSFTEMSGDHIVEQHVHNLDVANWFLGRPPVSAMGVGGRARRVTGDQFDFFSIDYDYGDGCHIHSICRQVNECANKVTEQFSATEGQVWAEARIARFDGKAVQKAKFETFGGPYVQEHVDLLDSIVKSQPLNEARSVAEATLTALMGRISAYTGQQVAFTDLVANQQSKWFNLTLSPTAADFETGSVKAPADDVIPKPGT